MRIVRYNNNNNTENQIFREVKLKESSFLERESTVFKYKITWCKIMNGGQNLNSF